MNTHVRRVKARRIAFWVLFFGVATSLLGWALVSAFPTAAYEVRGVAVEATRDVNRVPTAPVKYQVEGIERTELVSGIEVVAGEQVVVAVNEDGLPASDSWWLFVFVAAMGVAIVGGAALFTSALTLDSYDSRLAQAEWRDRSESGPRPVHFVDRGF